ncbi:hypothetical protein BRADI_1g77265v3 [Brachypodium distachyon]|uniref:Phospholipase D n=1 Tax=Brachypodium distachyon TaxID=15368 RepID=A0A0Q3HMR9_BRADI|nr:hypothetical protein BRADI_1g77265v3 [Brachypodium distachyon]
MPGDDATTSSHRPVRLHGSLDIWIHEARNLPNKDIVSNTMGGLLGFSACSSPTGAPSTSDPYVTVQLASATVARTYVIQDDENPSWSQHFLVPVAHSTPAVSFVVKDSDVFGAELIGAVAIPAELLLGGERLEGAYLLLEPSGKPCAPCAMLRLSVQYVPAARLTMYHHGVTAGPDFPGVPNTYFPLRRGGRVTLYQDAHVPDDGCLPEIKLGDDRGGASPMCYRHGQCWRDLYDAVSKATKLVYITGWSVFHTIHLVRDGDVGGEKARSLGDLLKRKSQEGVRVLLLVWDDPTSRSVLGIQMEGYMGTRDEETRRFFRHSSVQILLCPRAAGKRHSWVKQQETGTIFTHHQKTVIVDADAGNGLDLCGGRYDTPRHPLFRTLQTLHKDDYYNPNFAVLDARGPREPWHDLHSKIDGPAAFDVLKNFEERWLKASKRSGAKKLSKACNDTLLWIERIPEIVAIDDEIYASDRDPERWDVQIFRSIDSNSVKAFPKDPREATSKNLVCGKNVLIDTSIHTAYVTAIRAAQHFIYIENQYFLGSSFNWDSHTDVGANNLIPIEIALKIANKIYANERFSAYIIIPMWPEGNPTGAPTQRILYWQKKTMQMMYEIIYGALKEVGLDGKYEPQDYLNFFCLGNREAEETPGTSSGPFSASNPQDQSRKNRRFMVYVHSKGMIVDDEYVIIGSANINQRSMEGTRDTEIAMGAYQPQYTWANMLSAPRGQIYGYRMSLWAEHMGAVEEGFERPESVECVRRVRGIGEENWRRFVSEEEEVRELRGHLLKYPVGVDREGKVAPLPGCAAFPDLGGNICGSFLNIQENLTI